MTYAELQVTTHFSFLRGASSCEELFAQAAGLGLPALGVVDRHSLAGMVRAHEAARETGVRLVVGCRLDLTDGMAVLVYPTDRPAYSRLCRLLTLGKRRAGKGACELGWADLVAHGEGLLAVLVPDMPGETLAARLARLRDAFGDRAYLALTLRRRPNDALRLHELSNLAAAARVPTVATNHVLYHHPERRILEFSPLCPFDARDEIPEPVLAVVQDPVVNREDDCQASPPGSARIRAPRQAGTAPPASAGRRKLWRTSSGVCQVIESCQPARSTSRDGRQVPSAMRSISVVGIASPRERLPSTATPPSPRRSRPGSGS